MGDADTVGCVSIEIPRVTSDKSHAFPDGMSESKRIQPGQSDAPSFGTPQGQAAAAGRGLSETGVGLPKRAAARKGMSRAGRRGGMWTV